MGFVVYYISNDNNFYEVIIAPESMEDSIQKRVESEGKYVDKVISLEGAFQSKVTVLLPNDYSVKTI